VLYIDHVVRETADTTGEMEVVALHGDKAVSVDDRPIHGYRFRKLQIFDIDRPRAGVRANRLNSSALHKFGRLAFGLTAYTPLEDMSPSWCPVRLTIPNDKSATEDNTEMSPRFIPYIEEASEAFALIYEVSK
jgi:hypothetical protein